MFAPTSGTRPLLLAAAMLATFTFSAQAQDKAEEKIDLKKGAWSELAQYIGTYEYDAVLDNKHVKTQLDKLLKGQQIDLQSLTTYFFSITIRIFSAWKQNNFYVQPFF